MNAAPQFSILFVCTGNICRSPLAELLLWKSINTPAITTSSAGIKALVGYQMPAIQQEIAMKLGVQAPENHRARQLTLQDIECTDLILTMERQHRSKVVRVMPNALRRTFTMREFARIAELTPDGDLSFDIDENLVDRLKKLVDAAATNRGFAVPSARPEDQDVLDPYRRNRKAYLQASDQVAVALGRIVAYLNRAAD